MPPEDGCGLWADGSNEAIAARLPSKATGRLGSIPLKNAAAPARLERAKRMVKRCARSSVRFNWVLRPRLNVDCWFSPQAGVTFSPIADSFQLEIGRGGRQDPAISGL